MTFNSTSIADDIRTEMETLISLASEGNQETRSAYQMERTIWWHLLTLGKMLLWLFFSSCHEKEEAYSCIEVGGESYRQIRPRERRYISIFGELRFQRRGYWRQGKGCLFPMDAVLNLPQRSYSDNLQEMVADLSTEYAYDDVLSFMERHFQVTLSKESLEAILADHAAHHSSYEAQYQAPAPASEDTILVAQCDDIGVSMTATHSPPIENRRQGGKTASKMATVTAIYTIKPYYRSPQTVIDALLRDSPSDRPNRPTPHHKRIAGTLMGQAAGVAHLRQQANRYETSFFAHRVAVMDGAHSLHKQVAEQLPDFTLIVDIFHVAGYVREAGHALLGQDHPYLHAWLTGALECLLTDGLDDLPLHLEHQLPHLSSTKQDTIQTTLRYLRNQRPYMDYQTYLEHGFPIGSGVIEGTCCHLVEDRLNRSGMHWSPAGAQAMLSLRAVHINEEWDAFHLFRRKRNQQRLYPYDLTDFPDVHQLEPAA